MESVPSVLLGATVGYLAAGVTAAGLGWQAVRSRANTTTRLFAATMAAIVVWSLAYVARLFAGTVDAALAWTVVAYFGITTAPVGFVLFACSYAGYDRYVTTDTAALLLLVPAGTLAALVSSPLFGLHYASYELVTTGGIEVLMRNAGPWFWVHTAYSYLLLLVGTALLVNVAVTYRDVHRVQAGELVVGALVPWVVNAALVFGLRPHPTLDLTPVAFAAGSVFIALAVSDVPLTDVTPVARSAVVDAMHDSVVVVDDDVVIDANDAARALLGRPLVGRSVDAVLPGPLREADAEPRLVELSAERLPPLRRVGRPEPGASTHAATRWLRVQRVHVEADVDALLVSDATELERNRQRLERQNERLEEFTAAAAHDLRNPLNVIEGYTDVARGQADEAVVEHLDRIESSAKRMHNLVEDLLSLGQRARLVEEVDELDLQSVAERAWHDVATEEAELVVRSATVYGDDARLQQLFENLFRNAVEHAGPSVTVRVDGLSDGFYVEDDGPGIPTGERESVFDYGYSTADGGAGFGLSVVRIIADAHGWSVGVSEGRAGGARFEFTGVRTQPPATDRWRSVGAADD
ncbi:sensor histidine kinase [Halorarius halobius]|uniref:sensor histidine kinase n=1 Tax=Halorarius halobius TaxID=2962671 RepID=UPI0020CE6D38|nr:histidine kinase N-terminal 7TM domain-containing protein [Halorarius halobius]